MRNACPSISLLLLAAPILTGACSGGVDDTADTGGSAPTGGSPTGGGVATGGNTTGEATGGNASGGSAPLTGGSGGTGTGGDAAVVGCPEGESPPAGDCTDWSNTNTPEVCTYAAAQCYCQTGQQGATWMCGTCPVTPAQDAVCAATGMTCGDCVCEMHFVQGGQREWTFSCAG